MRLLLVNYRHTGSELGKSITSLPLHDALKIADALYNNSSCKAHKRFGSVFARYYEDRKQVEQWLYDQCLQMGGKPKVRYPIYFALQESEDLAGNYTECRTFKLHLDEIAENDISFTFGDSMALYYEGRLNRLLTREELLEQIKQHDSRKDGDDFFSKIRNECGFIEAQLWNEEYLNNPLLRQ